MSLVSRSVLPTLVALAVAVAACGPARPAQTRAYTELLMDVQNGAIARVEMREDEVWARTRDGTSYVVTLPNILIQVQDDVRAAADAGGVPMPEFVAKPPPDGPGFLP